MRCKLFVPGSRPELFAKAMAGEADAISIDLEDAVDESRKDGARIEVAKFLRSLPADRAKTVIVRVNGVDTPHFEKDLEAVVGPGLDLVNQPMPRGGDDVRHAAEALRRVAKVKGVAAAPGILANIETPRAFRLAAEIAAADPLVKGLQIGFGDLLEPYGIERYDPRVVLHFQLGVRVAARGGRRLRLRLRDGRREERRFPARGGGNGPPARLPRQERHPPLAGRGHQRGLPPDGRGDRPLAQGRSVGAENAAKGVGAWTVDGKMIDAPFVARAEAVLAVARRPGPRAGLVPIQSTDTTGGRA